MLHTLLVLRPGAAPATHRFDMTKEHRDTVIASLLRQEKEEGMRLSPIHRIGNRRNKKAPFEAYIRAEWGPFSHEQNKMAYTLLEPHDFVHPYREHYFPGTVVVAGPHRRSLTEAEVAQFHRAYAAASVEPKDILDMLLEEGDDGTDGDGAEPVRKSRCDLEYEEIMRNDRVTKIQRLHADVVRTCGTPMPSRSMPNL
jgi:hypothetical protein